MAQERNFNVFFGGIMAHPDVVKSATSRIPVDLVTASGKERKSEMPLSRYCGTADEIAIQIAEVVRNTLLASKAGVPIEE